MSQELLQKVREADVNVLRAELESLNLDPKTIKELKSKAFIYMDDPNYFHSILSNRDYNKLTGEDEIRLCYYLYISSLETQ